MLHPFFKVVKKTYIALVMLSNVHYIPAQIPETTPLPGGNQVECSSGMRIEKVVGNEKVWKVVISGQEKMWIDVKGFDFTPSEPYEWGLGSGSGPGYQNKWTLESASSLTDKGFIPQYALPQYNEEFGSKNGTIRLTDKYNNSVYSTDIRPNKKAQVFFLKDEPNFWHPTEPNWFHYWSQIVNLHRIKKIKYDDKDNNFACTTRFDNSFITTFRQEASEKNWITTHSGIHTFVETIVHENKHIEIWNNWWPNGYNISLDSDKDYVPDIWELNEGKIFKFDVPQLDGYEVGGMAGIKYEEMLCEIEELNSNFNQYDMKDWSFDLSHKFQGKQWK